MHASGHDLAPPKHTHSILHPPPVTPTSLPPHPPPVAPTSPHPCCRQVMGMPGMVTSIVESLKYLTPMAFDVMTFVILRQVRRGGFGV